MTAQPLNDAQRGYKRHAIQRGETFSVHINLLLPKPGFNERKLFKGLPELAGQIRTNGFRKTNPLIVEWDKEAGLFHIIHGERRYRACQLLLEQGHDPGPIWCMSESRETTPLQQLFDQLLTNTGEPFTPLEKGQVYLRIIAEEPTITQVEIATRVGESKQAVSNALAILTKGSAALIAAIEAEQLSCTTAGEIIRQAPTDHAAQNVLLQAALSAAADQGSTHATPKHIKKAPAKLGDAPHPQESDSTAPPAPDLTASTDTAAPTTQAPTFQLYLVDDAPAEPTEDGGHYETERLVLLHPPAGISLLHLLMGLDEDGSPVYGYRYNEITILPSANLEEAFQTLPDEGYAAALAALARFASALTQDVLNQLSEALYDALCRYHPESGLPEPAEHIPFVAPVSAPPERPPAATGYQAILNAPSTDRAGHSGPGSGGYVSPDKALLSIEKLLDDLDDQPTVADRRHTAEITLRVLRNESPLGALKTHLLGN